jgi:putative polyhydroxyalkanoate system protein
MDMTRRHSLSMVDARRMAERVVDELENRLGLFGLEREWAGDTLYLSATRGTARGVTGEIIVSAGSVRVTLRLSPALQRMQATLERALDGFLKRSFPG